MGLSMVIVAKFMMWLTEKGPRVALTERFHDAEFILTHHHPPETWRKPRSLFAKLMQGPGSSSWHQQLWQAIRSEQTDSDSENRLLQRLDNLIDFFETCPFFQDEASRDVMHDQLLAERERWVEEVRE